MSPRVLVTGGAGYVGSHAVRALLERDYAVEIVDDLSEGHREAVPREAPLHVVDIADRGRMDALFAARRFDGVLHFAARCYVGESVREPGAYYRANVGRTVELLEAMRGANITAFVFSSTCATYGDPVRVPMDEEHPQRPINPYGRSKLFVEQILADYARAHGLRAACLRYFNAAGAHPSGAIGEHHEPETHLIPLAIQAAQGLKPGLQIFGDDYQTRDGTCVRDYVHVSDLADAHVLALEKLAGHESGVRAWNLGTGIGSSVREVIRTVEEVSALRVPHRIAPRRAGDPPELVADGSRAARELGWSPRFATLRSVVETAWAWHRAHPRGYAECLR
ncbi:MAG: UDP-glucose 4-epimerase GalE [Planctomycetes bacterium]|nr:UDP-glucose 4-epimerase GalE [Planctomycetota bacterium]